jgi:hypothetical protein
MSESWRKYGGLNRPDAQNRFTVGTIVADEVLLREQVAGEFRIQGTATIEQELYALTDFFVDYNATIRRDLSVNEIGQINQLALGNSVMNLASANDKGFSINHNNAIATFDIQGYDDTQNWVLRAKSTGTEVYNIVAETADLRGVIAGSNPTETFIEFFSGLNPDTYGYTSEAKLMYTTQGGGKFKFSTQNLEFGDALQQVYLFDAYERDDVYTGRSLQLKSSRDDKSNTFVTITGLNGEGLALGGGLYPLDTTKEYTFIGVTDASDNLFPSIVTQRSDRIENRRIHMGLNTYDPRKEDYLLDVNGKVIISYGEVTRVYGDDIEPHRILLGDNRTTRDRLAIVGSSIDIEQPHNYGVYYSEDGAKIWTRNDLVEQEALALVPTKLAMSNYIVKNTTYYTGLQVIAGANNTFFATNSYCGKNGWNKFTFTNNTEGDTYFKTGADFLHIEVILGRVESGPAGHIEENVIDTLGDNNEELATIIVTEQLLDAAGNKVNPQTGLIESKTYAVRLKKNVSSNGSKSEFWNANWGPNIYLYRQSSGEDLANITGPYIDYESDILDLDGIIVNNLKQTMVTYKSEEQTIWAVGRGLVKLVNDAAINRISFVRTNSIPGTTITSDIWNQDRQYFRLAKCEQDNDYLIAVGENIISVSKDGGVNWNDRDIVDEPIEEITASLVDPLELYGVHILDISNAMIVGDRGTFIYTIDGALSWVKVPNFVLDGSGTGERIYGIDCKLLDIYIQSSETMVIVKEIKDFQEKVESVDQNIANPGQQGTFYVYYLTIPTLFNFSAVNILDICGNTMISGNLTLDRGRVITLDNNVDFFNETVETLNMGSDLQVANFGKILAEEGTEEYDEVGRNATRYNFKGDLIVSERFSLGKGVDNALTSNDSSGLGTIVPDYTADVSGNIYQRGFVHQF